MNPDAAKHTYTWISLAVLAITLLFAIDSLQPPDAADFDLPESVFSSKRAEQTLHFLLADEQPHPVGSDANHAVRDRLIETLQSLGLTPEIQRTIGCSARRPVCATVENVLAEIPGQSRDAIVIMAHYDSVPHAPGAADDGAGVAAIIETARVLMLDATPRNRVLLVFTDAEEVGLLGAEAFFKQHPWADDVKAVINIEGSGSGGPAFLLRTTGHGGRLLQAFRESATEPTALSVSQEIFARMPNDTDFSVSERAGIPSIDFAFAFEKNHYHTPLDTIENLDKGALQHHGLNVLPMTRRLVQMDLGATEPNFSYTTVSNAFWIAWPTAWTLPLAILALCGLLIASVRVKAGIGILACTALALILVVLGMGLCYLGFYVADLLAGTRVSFPANPWPWRLLIYGAAGLSVSLIGWWSTGRYGFWQLFLGVWWLLGFVAVFLAAVAPLAANVVLISVLVAALLALILSFTPFAQNSNAQFAVMTACIVVFGYSMLALSYANEQTQGLRLAPTIYGGVVLIALALLPLKPGRGFSALGFTIFVIGTLAAGYVDLYSEWRPQHVSVYYIQDVDNQTARIAALSANPLPAQLLVVAGKANEESPLLPWSSSSTTTFDAVYEDVPAPQIKVSRTAGEISVSYVSRSNADFMMLVLPYSAGVSDFEVDGHPVTTAEQNGFFQFILFAPPQDGLTLSFSVTDTEETIDGYLLEGSNILPDAASEFSAGRGKFAVPQHRGDQAVSYQKLTL